MSFKQFICWKPEELDWMADIDVTGFEHLAEGDDSFFLSTHHPFSVQKFTHLQTLQEKKSAKNVTEEDLLSDFTAEITDASGYHNFIITGATGVGKSHFVKWLHAQCSEQENWHQVYVKKSNTNLHDIILEILKGFEGKNIEDIREKLNATTSDLHTLEHAKKRLRSELSLACSREKEGDDDYRKVARRLAPIILDDPALQKFWFNEENGAIHRIAKLHYEKLTGQEEERDLSFGDKDLPDSAHVAEVLDTELSKPAKDAYVQIMSDTRLKESVIALLEHEKTTAITRTFIGEGVSLTVIFNEVRTEVKKRKKDLVLYIEDLVVFNSIEEGLLTAFTTPVSDGDYANLRTAIAVTDGWFTDAHRTQTDRMKYWIQLNQSGTETQFIEYVARYLNAARLGKKKLTKARQEGETGNWIPNACNDCNHEVQCHDAFESIEVNGEAYGLYPFNKTSISKLVKDANDIAEPKETFDPRKILETVVGSAYKSAATEIKSGDFPSKLFAIELDENRKHLSLDIKHQLEGKDRHISLLNFWCEALVSPVNMDEQVHEAFDLPIIKDFGQDDGGKEEPTPPRPPKTNADDEAIEKWTQGTTLPATRARIIRNFISASIGLELQNGPYGLYVVSNARSHSYKIGGVHFRAESVNIENAAGGGTEAKSGYTIDLKNTIKNAVLMLSILKFESTGKWESVEKFLNVSSRINDFTNELLAVIEKEQPLDLNPSVRILSLLPLSSVEESEEVSDKLNALLADKSMIEDLDDEKRSREWKKWVKESKKHSDVLQLSLYNKTAQTRGSDPQLIDSTLFSECLVSDSVGGMRVEEKTNYDLLKELREKAFDGECEGSRKVLSKILQYMSAEDSLEDVFKAVQGVLEEAKNNALLSDPVDTEDELTDLISDLNQSKIEMFYSIFSNHDKLEIERNRYLFKENPKPVISEVLNFLETSNKMFTETSKKLENLSDSEPQITLGEFKNALKVGDKISALLAQEGKN